jgi:hypothetical protein
MRLVDDGRKNCGQIAAMESIPQGGTISSTPTPRRSFLASVVPIVAAADCSRCIQAEIWRKELKSQAQPRRAKRPASPSRGTLRRPVTSRTAPAVQPKQQAARASSDLKEWSESQYLMNCDWQVRSLEKQAE